MGFRGGVSGAKRRSALCAFKCQTNSLVIAELLIDVPFAGLATNILQNAFREGYVVNVFGELLGWEQS